MKRFTLHVTFTTIDSARTERGLRSFITRLLLQALPVDIEGIDVVEVKGKKL